MRPISSKGDQVVEDLLPVQTAICFTVHLPLFLAVVAFVGGRVFGRRASELAALVAGFLALVGASLIAYGYTTGVYRGSILAPIVPGWWPNLVYYIDGLSAYFSIIVAIIGFLVIVYSTAYMKQDTGYARYYSFITLFLASMEGLVLSGDLVALYAFWEAVGLCSFALIGHYYYSPKASRAAIKALITTRLGDVALLAGIVYVYMALGTTRYDAVGFALAHASVVAQTLLLLALIGAMAKSAQFPLHIWLPDAMEGPTPVSALIHAATMVKAGLYLMLRLTLLVSPLIPRLANTYTLIAAVGAVTAVYAAICAAAQYDAKRMLAYSTISQLGYMFAILGATGGVGLEAVGATVEHVASHAVFKALLFLVVGVIVHELEPLVGPETARDIRYVAGAARLSLATSIGLVAGASSLAGLPPFAGAWSKEALVEAAFNSHIPWLVLAILSASIATAFYAGKLVYYLVFEKPRDEIRLEKVPATMSIPILILSALTIAIPFIVNIPFREAMPEPSILASLASLAVVLCGLGLAAIVYSVWQRIREAGVVKTLWKAAFHGLYIDAFYNLFLVPVVEFLATLSACGIMEFVDGIIDSLANISSRLASSLARFHRGKLTFYYAAYVAGLTVILIATLMGLWGGKP